MAEAFVVPSFFETIVVPTDVVDIINQLSLNIVANAGWVEGPVDTFTTPADAAGRFFRLVFLRFGATELHCTMTDDQGRSSQTKRFDLTPGSTITFFYSAKYLCIVQYGTPHYIFGMLMTLFPESETAHLNYCEFNAHFTTAGSGTASGTDRWEKINNANVYADTIGCQLQPRSRSGGVADMLQHVSGALRAYPVMAIGEDVAGLRIRGKWHNAVILHVDDAPAGAERPIPIGGGISSVFKALNIGADDGMSILIRKSGS